MILNIGNFLLKSKMDQKKVFSFRSFKIGSGEKVATWNYRWLGSEFTNMVKKYE